MINDTDENEHEQFRMETCKKNGKNKNYISKSECSVGVS